MLNMWDEVAILDEVGRRWMELKDVWKKFKDAWKTLATEMEKKRLSLRVKWTTTTSIAA